MANILWLEIVTPDAMVYSEVWIWSLCPRWRVRWASCRNMCA